MCAGRPAFTLIEIVLVITVMLLAMTALIPLMNIRSEERELRKTADTLEKFARTGRSAALYERAFSAIEILPTGFTLKIESPQAIPDDQDPDAFTFFTDEPEVPEAIETYTHSLPKNAKVQIKAWTENKWRTPEQYIWQFQQSGLCEPLQFRFSIGEAWIELGFSPLTAEVQEESYAFP